MKKNHLKICIIFSVVVISTIYIFFFMEKSHDELVKLNNENNVNPIVNQQAVVRSQSNNPSEIHNEISMEPPPLFYDPEEIESEYASINSNPAYPYLNMRLIELLERRPEQHLTESEVLEQMKLSTAWQPVNEPPTTLNLTDEEMNDGREFIRFNAKKIESLSVGDTIYIPLAQTMREYKMEILKVEVFDDGNVTWQGQLTDFSGANQASITQSEGITAGEFSTEEGHFTLRSHNGDGWIVNTASLFKVNPNMYDYIEADGSIPEGFHDHK